MKPSYCVIAKEITEKNGNPYAGGPKPLHHQGQSLFGHFSLPFAYLPKKHGGRFSKKAFFPSW